MLTGTDLLEPLGILTPGMFPGDASPSATLDEYLATAYERADAKAIATTDRDDYARALVYARAWERVVTRLTATPATVSLTDQGSRAYSGEQLRQAVAAVDRWTQVAADLEPLPKSVEPASTPGSMFLPTIFTF